MSFSQVTTANDGLNSGLNAGRKPHSLLLSAIFPLDLVHRVGEFRRHQREYRYLLTQPDHMLGDIGLTRTQIIEAMRWRHF